MKQYQAFIEEFAPLPKLPADILFKKFYTLLGYMKYNIEFKPKAIKDLEKISKDDQKKLIARIENMSFDLKGDIKKLTNFTPEYRMRYRHFRVLFEIESNFIIIYRIKHRSKSYK